MKFEDFEFTEQGWNVNLRSKLLEFMILHSGKRLLRKLIKQKILTKGDKVKMSADYTFKFIVKKEKK